jgi:hypothetical protein
MLMPPERPGAGEPFRHFDGRSPALDDWQPPAVAAVRDGSAGLQMTDFAVVWVEPAVSRGAVEALGDVLRAHGELLPLLCPDGEYYAYNVTTLRDALDEEGSSVVRFTTGRVMRIDRYAFRTDQLHDVEVFKIPQLPKAFVFMTGAFLERVRAAGMTGLDPELVWEQKPSPAA